MIEEGTSFSPGALFLGLDLAMELDQMAAKHACRLLDRLRSLALVGVTLDAVGHSRQKE